MVPESYGYTEKEHPYETCLNCEHRWVAFHLMSGTSFCNLHKARTQSSSYHTCSDFKKDQRPKPTWTQSIGMAFKMPLMEQVECITTLSTEGYCPTCRHYNKAGGFGYCTRYFNDLKGTDRTCSQCQVGTWGKCNNYECYLPYVTGIPPKTESGGIILGNNIISLNLDTGDVEVEKKPE